MVVAASSAEPASVGGNIRNGADAWPVIDVEVLPNTLRVPPHAQEERVGGGEGDEPGPQRRTVSVRRSA